MKTAEIDNIIDWCKQRRKRNPYAHTRSSAREEAYDEALLHFMSYLHNLKWFCDDVKRENDNE